jgi:hypothetical protein
LPAPPLSAPDELLWVVSAGAAGGFIVSPDVAAAARLLPLPEDEAAFFAGRRVALRACGLRAAGLRALDFRAAGFAALRAADGRAVLLRAGARRAVLLALAAFERVAGAFRPAGFFAFFAIGVCD